MASYAEQANQLQILKSVVVARLIEVGLRDVKEAWRIVNHAYIKNIPMTRVPQIVARALAMGEKPYDVVMSSARTPESRETPVVGRIGAITRLEKRVAVSLAVKPSFSARDVYFIVSLLPSEVPQEALEHPERFAISATLVAERLQKVPRLDVNTVKLQRK